MDRPVDLQKIPVDCLKYYGSFGSLERSKGIDPRIPAKWEWIEYKTLDQFDKNSFGPCFRIDTGYSYRKEFAALRKAVKAYIIEKDLHRQSFDTRGDWWEVKDEFFTIFADWIELPDTLEALKVQAIEDAKIREAKRKKDEEERKERERLEAIAKRKAYHQEKRAYRIPCTGPCKVHILKITCYGQEKYEPLYEGEPVQYKFDIELNEGQTPQEKKARHALRFSFCGNQQKKYGINTSDISGYMCKWKMREYVLRSYLDWLEFEEDFETLVARAVEKFKQEEEERKKRKEEEELRWEEIRKAHDRYWREHARQKASWDPWQPRGQVHSALLLFGLDDTATQDDVKKKYRQLAKQYHPDTGGDAEKFKQLNQANQVLMQIFT